VRKLDGKFHIEGDQIVKSSSGEVLPEDEPLFLLRARDHLALRLLRLYRSLSVEDGCNDFHLTGLDEVTTRFARFAAEHPEQMKQPGVTRGLPWVPKSERSA
jgi:hypothetical protein